MMIDEKKLLYVFKSAHDEWLEDLKEIFTGPLAWDDDEFWHEWVDYDMGMPFPSEFAQLMIVYRYSGMTPSEAVDTLVRHPDYEYLAQDWKDAHDD